MRRLKYTAVLLGLVVQLLCIHTNAQSRKGLQPDKRSSLSVLGGGSLFFGEAYPKDILNTSYGVLMEKQMASWIGFRLKLDGGVLTGRKVLANKTEMFSSKTNFSMISVGAYLDAMNVLFGIDRRRKFELYGHANVGILSASYETTVNNDTYQWYKFGTSNNPEVVPTITGGGGINYKINDKWSIKMEATGVVEFSDNIDGIGEIYRGTEVEPIGGWDNFFLVQVGVKYKFGKLVERFGGRKNWMNLPSMQPVDYHKKH